MPDIIRHLLATHVFTEGGIAIVHEVNPLTALHPEKNLAEYDRGAFRAPDQYRLDALASTRQLAENVWFRRVLVPASADPLDFIEAFGADIVRHILADATRILRDDLDARERRLDTLVGDYLDHVAVTSTDPFETCDWCEGCGTDVTTNTPCPDCNGTGFAGADAAMRLQDEAIAYTAFTDRRGGAPHV